MTQPVNHGKTSPNDDATCSQQIADYIREAVGDQNYQHWLAGKSRFDITDNKLLIFVPNPFISNWLLKRFRSAFNAAAVSLLGPSACFELFVDEKLQIKQADPTGKTGALKSTDKQTASHHPTSGTKPVLTADGIERLAVRPASGRKMRKFGSLITGECNDLAVMAARQVAQYPGERFNPLYVYGPTGVGKTHLLESIYCDLRQHHPNLNVVLITSEAFTNYFLQALASKTVPSFRQKFRNVDVLMVDNVEFLDNKRATEEEFLHTIVQIIEQGGQLVISGDRHPRLLSKHRDEVTTRLQSGLVCRIDSPSEETRRRVAASLALPIKQSFTQETLDYVARRCRKNVREIQGAINCLHGHYSLTGTRITVARAREILGELERECRRLVRISDVEKVICDAFGLKTTDLRSKSRRKVVSHPRALAMFVARKLTKSAYREIGMYFGGRDHSTVVAAEKRVQKWMKDNAPLDIPTSCHGQTVSDVIQEIEERLMSLSA